MVLLKYNIFAAHFIVKENKSNVRCINSNNEQPNFQRLTTI